MQSDVLNVPTVDLFQFQGSGNGIGNSVNLFRGEVNFHVPLVSLSGRNGLDLQVAALYHSSEAYSASIRNLDAPTSVLGLGWSVPFEWIEVETCNTGALADNIYYFVRNESRSRLYQIERQWQRGTLAPDFGSVLDTGILSDALFQAILDQGINLDAGAIVTVLVPTESWTISDVANEFALAINQQGDVLNIYDGGVAYENQMYDFSRIRYYRDFERWEITFTNGITNVYGGGLGEDGEGYRFSAGASIQWGVKWGNFIGPSSLTHSPTNSTQRVQQQYALVWNMSGAYTPWGDRTTFAYKEVLQRVGQDGLPYTKASYLDVLTDVFGRTIRFFYLDKEYNTGLYDPREYADPYKSIPNNEPDAFQSRYETLYLDRIEVANEDGIALYSLLFTYSIQEFAALPSGSPPDLYGNLFKRILASVRKVFPSGESLPDIRLTYYGGPDNNPGALKSLTFPEGATVTYTYEQQSLKNCARDFRIDSPFAQGGPRLWFGNDYVLVTWYDTSGKLAINIYTWLGWWQKWTPATRIVSDFPDMQNFHAEVRESFCVLYFRTLNGQDAVIRAYHKDPRTLGNWLEWQKNPLIVTTPDVTVCSGTEFFAVANNETLTLDTYTWDGRQNVWVAKALTGICDGGTPGKTLLFVVGGTNVLGVLCYDEAGAPGAKRNLLSLFYLDALSVWRLGDSMTVASLAISGVAPEDKFYWTPLPWAFVATYIVDDKGSEVAYNLEIFSWGAEGANAYKLTDPVVKTYRLPKSQPSQNITIPFVAQGTVNGLVSSGPNLLRYNGVEWLENDNLAINPPVTDDELFWFALGPDYAVKSQNSTNMVTAQLQVYDPNTQAAKWNESVISLYKSAASGDRITKYYPTAGADYLSWNVSVYCRGSSTDWIVPVQNPVFTFPSTIDTTTVVNSGPSFMAYKLADTKGNPMGTQLTVIKNGVIEDIDPIKETFFSLVKEDGSLVANTEGRASAGLNAFVTYLPLNKDFSEATSITLYRYMEQSITKPVTVCPVIKLVIDNGLGQTAFSYRFDDNTAVCDTAGTIAKYYKASVCQGSFADPVNGYTEYCFYNGVGLRPIANNPTSISYFDGIVLSKRTYNGSNGLVASTDYELHYITDIASTIDEEPDTPIYGAIVQVASTTEMLDSVSRTTQFVYSACSGGVRAQSTTFVNSSGLLETRSQVTTYGYSEFDVQWYLNDLASVIQNQLFSQVEGERQYTTSSNAVTLRKFTRDNGSGYRLAVPSAYQTYVFLGGDGGTFDFKTWTKDGTAPSNWLLTAQTSMLSERGLTLEREAPIGTPLSTVYDDLEGVAVAAFTNARVSRQEAFYFGFESYEVNSVWELGAPMRIVDTISHAGNCCLELPGSLTGSGFALSPENASQRYLFSFWGYAPAGYAESSPAGFEITVSGAGGAATTRVELAASGEWEYYHFLIAEQQGGGQNEIQFIPFNEGEVAVYIDDVAFAAFEGQYSASVFDPVYFKVTEELGAYNAVLRRTYDSLQRLVVQTTDMEAVARVFSPFLSRQVDGTFLPGEPNALVNSQPMGRNAIDRFRSNGDWSGHWQSDQASQWTSDRGKLYHAGGQYGSIRFVEPAMEENYVVQLDVSFPATPAYPVGVQVGAGLTIQFIPSSKQWQLIDVSSGVTLEPRVVTAGPGSSWTLILCKKAILFLSDGRLVFSYVPAAEMPAGNFGLFATDALTCASFVIAEAPQVGAKFLDGTGKTHQGHAIDGLYDTVVATVYDELMRPAVTTKATLLLPTPEYPLLAWRGDAVTSFDWDSGEMTGAIADGNVEDEGYPYSRRRFEDSPLSRTTEIGAPGKDFAIVDLASTSEAGRHTVKYAYGANESGGFPEPLSLPGGKYYLTTRTDQDGNVSKSVSDTVGGQVADGMIREDGTAALSSYFVQFDENGRAETTRLPNFYAAPPQGGAENFYRTCRFDFQDRPVCGRDPNSGVSQYLYDTWGLLRFSQGSTQAAASQIAYAKYDEVQRVIEVGLFPGDWDTSFLQEKADNDPEFPGIGQNATPQYTYVYSGDSAEVSQMGMLTQVSVLRLEGGGDASYRADYTYDEQNRLKSSRTIVMDVGPQEMEVDYTYDNLGNVESTSYPSGLVLISERDEIGRVVSICDPDGNRLWAGNYNAGDQGLTEAVCLPGGIATETTYAYNSPGWLTRIESPQMLQTISFTEGGFKGAGYYTGKVACVATNLKAPTADYPASLTYRMTYDALSRLITCQALSGDQENCQYSLGLQRPVSYDANGNFDVVEQGDTTDDYTYEPGTDRVLNTDGSSVAAFQSNAAGAIVVAAPREITQIDWNLYTSLPSRMATEAKGNIDLQYDNNGNRVLKTSDTGALLYVRGESGYPLSQEGTGDDAIDYLYGPQGLFAVRRNGAWRMVQRDHIKSTRLVLAANGDVIDSFQYLPFGDVISSGSDQKSTIDYLFSGYEIDTETGLYNGNARIFDPQLRRFYSLDPKMQTPTPYLYAGNSPFTMLDPDGKDYWWATLIGVVVGLVVTVATGGAGAVLLGTEVAAGIASAAVAGTVGSVAGDMTSSFISSGTYIGQRALVSGLAGLAGGAVGAGVGGLAGTAAMGAVFRSGLSDSVTFVARVGAVVGGTTGGAAGGAASAGVVAGMSGKPFFSKETALNVALGAAAGFGGALLGSGAYLGLVGNIMPVKMTAGELGDIEFLRISGTTAQTRHLSLFTSVSEEEYLSTRLAIRIKIPEGDNAVFRLTPNGQPEADVIAMHGVGRFVLPYTQNGYRRPVSARLFGDYLSQRGYARPADNAGPVPPLKLLICFAASPVGGVGQTLASALGRTVYAGRGVVYPWKLTQNWVQFT